MILDDAAVHLAVFHHDPAGIQPKGLGKEDEDFIRDGVIPSIYRQSDGINGFTVY